ncbi:ribonuclease T2-like [Podochytrium sp. JEL0797]|nr:ribonuclease T2-like [Podochytrium sp. JEL0797]
MALSSANCPSFAVGCQPNPITAALYPECCVSNNIFVFAQNYTVGLSYKTPNFDWTHNAVVADIGPKFSMHGLWADNCDGSYNGTKWNTNHTAKVGIDYDLIGCDASRATENAGDLIQGSCSYSYLYDWMNKNWRAGNGDNNWFWSHEWSKHGTCTGSFAASCFDGSIAHQDMFTFFQTSIEVFTKLDIMSAFTSQGIYPSDTTTYTLAQLNAAHKSAFGFTGGMQCVKNSGKQYLNEVWSYLTEAPGHKYIVADPSIAGANPYQACNGSLPIYFPLTANVNAN